MATINRSKVSRRTDQKRVYSLGSNATTGPCGYTHWCKVTDDCQRDGKLIQSVDTPYNFTEYSESVTSVSSPGFYTKKQVRVQWIPKKYPLHPPSRPVFRPFELPKEPKHYSKNVNIAFNQRVKFLKKYRAALERRRIYISGFNKRLAKYDQRYAKYLHYLRLNTIGVPRYRRVRVKSSSPQQNPYTRTKTKDHGWSGQITMTDRRLYAVCNKTPPHPGTIQTWGSTSPLGKPYLVTVWTGQCNWTPASYGSPDLGVEAAADSHALTKLFTKMKSSTVHVGNLLAERHKTFAMLREIVQRVASVIRLKKHLLNNLTSKQLANDTLAFQFGITPLLSDAYSAGEALARLTTDSPEIITVRASAKADSESSDDTEYRYNPTYNCNVFGKMHRRVKRTVRVSYVLKYRISSGTFNTLSQLGLVNPAEIAWELLPWSFAIDWFLPLGNYISSLTADTGLTFIGGTKTITTTTEYETSVTYEPDPVGYRSYSGAVNGKKVVESKVRTVLNTPPTPQLPNFKNPFSTNHLIDALALLRQQHR